MKKSLHISLLFFFLFNTVCSVRLSLAGPQIPGFYGTVPNLPTVVPNALPSVKGIIQGVSSIDNVGENQLLIHQSQEKAIIDWHSFNIGEQASTHFDQQKNANWAALNRIYDQNPSQILGKLSADGRIYLINQNGILFGPNSQVNVHSLIGSSLNTTNDDFLNGVLKFKVDNYTGDPNFSQAGTVSNHGGMVTDELGSIFLLAPTVENSGEIVTPLGQIGLAAATEVEIAAEGENSQRTALVVDVKEQPGIAHNLTQGRMSAETGTVGMYGNVVNQEGLIRAVTAVERKGSIELIASDQVKTGTDSLTACPVTESPIKVHESFEFSGGNIKIEATNRIEHNGSVEAPSGEVSLQAGERIFLGDGSAIDVGGLWIEQSGMDNITETQLNSVELRNDYGQKDGLLKGETIQVAGVYGTSIGDVSNAMQSEEKTAVERSTAGGRIDLSSNGDVVATQGSLLGFSGGGIRYQDGHVATTKLAAGNQVYDISNAPEWVRYDKVLGYFETVHERYGMVDVFEGLSYGGAAPLIDFAGNYAEGHDAGNLRIVAPRIVLKGRLNGSAQRGIFQNDWTDTLQTRGTKVPRGGTLEIGNSQTALQSPETEDHVVHEIILTANADILPPGFAPETPLPVVNPENPSSLQPTILSTDRLNDAGLSSVSLFANTRFETKADASVSLSPGSVFEVLARSIEHSGKITVPGGTISLEIRDNVTAIPTIADAPNIAYLPMKGHIYLADGSAISAAGERVDKTLEESGLGAKTIPALVDGGLVSLTDNVYEGTSDGIITKREASMDVSGGYEINAAGVASGGDGGTLEMTARTLVLEGKMSGYSLLENTGGTIFLHAGEVVVGASPTLLPDDFGADSDVPAELTDKLILSGTRLKDTGFTHVKIASGSNLTVLEGTLIEPSWTKTAYPAPGNGDLGIIAPTDAFVTAMPEEITSSSIGLFAGRIVRERDVIDAFEAAKFSLTIAQGAEVSVAPGGEIDLSSTGIVDIVGDLQAYSGAVDITAVKNIVLRNGASIVAKGINIPDKEPFADGMPPGFRTLSGGQVRLKSEADVVLEQGSLVDVSGSALVTDFIQNTDGTISSFGNAGAPGSLDISYFNALILDGAIEAKAQLAGLPGGSLSVFRADPSKSMDVSAGLLTSALQQEFDDLSFGSRHSLHFVGPIDLHIDRGLTLDAPMISGSGDDIVRLAAPWVQIVNNSEPYEGQTTTGGAQIFLSGDAMDVEGSVVFAGFGDRMDVSGVQLLADADMTLTEKAYTTGSSTEWEGLVKTGCSLTLEASRIYPTTLSNFTIQSGEKATILSSGRSAAGPVYSAGASLTIEAKDIEHQGVLAAPMGKLTLTGTDRVYLAPGSVTTTLGTTSVNYGSIDEEKSFWTIPDKASQASNLTVASAPEKSVDISGNEIIVRDGALVDASGGGSVFGYVFLPGIEGSENPITKDGRLVILSDNSVVLPGPAVYLEGGDSLEAGTYSILPEEYAFLPQALILRNVGPMTISGKDMTSKEGGHPVVGGYATFTGTDVARPQRSCYEVRPAREVLSEGYFTIKEAVAGNGGAIRIGGVTTILEGKVLGQALPTFTGASLSVSGRDVVIESKGIGAALSPDFDFSDPIPSDLVGTLHLAVEDISGKGISHIKIGEVFPSNEDIAENPALKGKIPTGTATIVLESGAVLEVPRVTLSAMHSITIEEDAQINALGEGSEVSFIFTETPLQTLINDGIVNSNVKNELKISIQDKALVHASDKITFGGTGLDIQGDIQVDNSAIALASDRIAFVSDDYDGERFAGLLITERLWNAFREFEEVELSSGSDLLFLGDFELDAADTISISAGLIVGLESAALFPDGNGKADITIKANQIRVFNNGAGVNAEAFGENVKVNDVLYPIADNGSIAFEAGSIHEVGHGDVLFDGFSHVNLLSQGNLTFEGAGSLGTTGADLLMATAKVTTSPYAISNSRGESSLEAVNFLVDTAGGNVSIQRRGDPSGISSAPGGTLQIQGRNIDLEGTVETPSGYLRFSALEKISIKDGALIQAVGTAHSTGGFAEFESSTGSVEISRGAVVDVSAGDQGDAGTVSLKAQVGGVVVPDGTIIADTALRGHAHGDEGHGGSFILDTKQLALDEQENEFARLNTVLKAGGFDELIDVQVREGYLTVAADQTVAARKVVLAADNGDIAMQGVIDASSPDQGGRIELHAKDDIHLVGTLIAAGTGPEAVGGEVLLNAGHVDVQREAIGGIDFQQNGIIDVSGQGQGGAVEFVALRDGATVNMDLRGTVLGASAVNAYAVAVYDKSRAGQSITAIENIVPVAGRRDSVLYMADLKDDTAQFLSQIAQTGTDIFSNMTFSGPKEALRLLPGVEIQAPGNLNFKSDFEFSSSKTDPATWWRFGTQGDVGILTLRAQGDLNINGNIVDYPHGSTNSLGQFGDTWGLNLVAGADLTSAYHLATKEGCGNLTIADDTTVFTESPPIWFASGGDTIIGKNTGDDYKMCSSNQSRVYYSIGTFDGDIHGQVSGNLFLDGGIIQSALGDVTLDVAKDIRLADGGSIRTIGYLPEGFNKTPYGSQEPYWEYMNGGNIRINSRGAFEGFVKSISAPAWDKMYQYSVRPTGIRKSWGAHYGEGGAELATQGLATMGGGNLEIHTGGDFLCQAGAFGEGNMAVYSGGDLDGRFLVNKGIGRLHSMGDFGQIGSSVTDTAIEAGDARLYVSAQQSIELGTVVNPTFAQVYYSVPYDTWNLTYAEDSGVYLTAINGDVSLSGRHEFYQAATSANLNQHRLLPPSLEISAGGDIVLFNSFALAPSESSSLILRAGGDIQGRYFDGSLEKRAMINMSDLEPESVLGMKSDIDKKTAESLIGAMFNMNKHGNLLIHENDPNPIVVEASKNIENLRLGLPKRAEISAGEDIVDILYVGQNLLPSDVSIIQSQGSMLFSSLAVEGTAAQGNLLSGIDHGGPGLLIVQAGESLDLGTSKGIRSVGNQFNQTLGEKGSTLAVLAGYNIDTTEEDLASFFEALREGGKKYSEYLAAEDLDQASSEIDRIRSEVIEDLLGNTELSEQTGNLNMVFSQINTSSGPDDLYILSKGDVNVGQTTFFENEEDRRSTGIFTAAGGEINIFSDGDINVNESRVMTFMGGDITMWSDHGNINAGRGSKTAISTEPPKAVVDESGVVVIRFQPPAVGSGIRAVTFDPDGPGGPKAEPPAGDLYVFAPDGEIDAGEAGMMGTNVFLGATKILNAQNISFSAGSVGVPVASEAGPSIGALAGVGNIADTSKLAEQTAALTEARERMAQDGDAMAKSFTPKWLRVEFIGFEEEED